MVDSQKEEDCKLIINVGGSGSFGSNEVNVHVFKKGQTTFVLFSCVFVLFLHFCSLTFAEIVQWCYTSLCLICVVAGYRCTTCLVQNNGFLDCNHTEEIPPVPVDGKDTVCCEQHFGGKKLFSRVPVFLLFLFFQTGME